MKSGFPPRGGWVIWTKIKILVERIKLKKDPRGEIPGAYGKYIVRLFPGDFAWMAFPADFAWMGGIRCNIMNVLCGCHSRADHCDVHIHSSAKFMSLNCQLDKIWMKDRLWLGTYVGWAAWRLFVSERQVRRRENGGEAMSSAPHPHGIGQRKAIATTKGDP